MRLVHYSGKPLGELRTVEPPPIGALKPTGLWVSDDDCVENWPWWCTSEGFRVDHLTHAHDMELGNEHQCLLLDTCSAIDSFTAEYEVEFIPGMRNGMFINWPRVMREYSAIVCTPYLWERRLGPMWYYSWDCASGCIWDMAAIKSIRPRVGIVPAAPSAPAPAAASIPRSAGRTRAPGCSP